MCVFFQVEKCAVSILLLNSRNFNLKRKFVIFCPFAQISIVHSLLGLHQGAFTKRKKYAYSCMAYAFNEIVAQMMAYN